VCLRALHVVPNIRLMPEDATPEQLAWGIEGASMAWPEHVHRYLLDIQAETAARLGPLRARIKPLVGGVYRLSEFHKAQADFIAKDFVGKLVVVPDEMVLPLVRRTFTMPCLKDSEGTVRVVALAVRSLRSSQLKKKKARSRLRT